MAVEGNGMIIDLGFIDYEKAYKVQKEFVKLRKLSEIGDSLLVAEHPAVFTIGRTGKIENLLVADDFLKEHCIKILRVDRGGDITFHGPGQIVLYPIIDLKSRKTDLHEYLRGLEEVAITFLAEYAVTGRRVIGKTGVWIGDKKIASIGVGATGWVTYHGMSFNVNADLSFFSMINPCGLSNCRVTNLSEELQRFVPLSEVKEKIIRQFVNIFRPEKMRYEREPAAVA